MGNYSQRYQQSCLCCTNQQSETHKKLRRLYKDCFEDHPLGLIALETLKQYEGQDLNQVDPQYLNKSMIETHYEQNQINYVDEDEDPQYSIINMSPQQKEKHLMKLLKESYILLDLSDMLEGSHRRTYERQVKHELMDNRQSFLSKNPIEKIEDMVKQFNPVVISRLSQYVKFCSHVKQQFQPTAQNYYSTLLIRLKASIIEKHRANSNNISAATKTKNKIQILIDDVINLCFLLMETVFTQFSISNKSQKYAQDQHNVNFYDQPNVYTMIMSIIFSDHGFHDFMREIIEKYLQTDLKLYENSPVTKNNELIKALKEVQHDGRPSRNNLQGKYVNVHNLFQPRNQTNSYNNIFSQSCRILRYMNKKYQPISKLKIFYQLYQKIKQQFESIFEKEDVHPPFTRQSLTLIAKWMLNREKLKSKDTIISILITYWFIHERYRQVEKGSCLIPFVEEAEYIIKWNSA